jgi:hypothetical protein
MTTYGSGLEYDAALDVLAHAISNVAAGVYDNPTRLQIDGNGHIVDIETGSTGAGYIEGLGFQYTSQNVVTFDPGAAFVPGHGRAVSLDSPQTVTRFDNTADAVDYFYLREINDEGFVEASNVPPADPYFGSACIKDGDAYSRYLGMLRRVSSNFYPFTIDDMGGRLLRVLYDVPPQLLNLSAAADTSKVFGITATLAADRWIAPNSRSAIIEALSSPAGNAKLGWSNSAAQATRTVRSLTGLEMSVALGPDQEVEYYLPASTTLTAWLVGYLMRR